MTIANPSCRLARSIVTLGLILVVSEPTLAGGDPGKPLVLFDGKGLAGWKKTDFYKAGEVEIQVEDRAILLPVGSPMAGVTSTRRDLPTTNYELIYEAKRISGDDFFAAATFPVGRSHITLVNGGWGGSVTGLSSLNGSDASENETNRFIKYRNETWYRFRVVVTDQVIRGWMDDKELFQVHHADIQVGTRIETRASQPLGFATWKSSGAIRKVEVRLLSPEEVATVNKVAN